MIVTQSKYKATFILDTRGWEQPVESLIEKLKETIKAAEAEVLEVKNLGQKEFARVTDRNFPSGLYVQIHFQGPPTSPTQIKEKLRLEKTINRVIIQSINSK